MTLLRCNKILAIIYEMIREGFGAPFRGECATCCEVEEECDCGSDAAGAKDGWFSGAVSEASEGRGTSAGCEGADLPVFL